MQSIRISYLSLSPELNNKYINVTHKVFYQLLNESFNSWNFQTKYPGFNLGFIVVRKIGIEKLEIKGPSISKKMKLIDYSIFLPEKETTLKEYISLFFEGLSIANRDRFVSMNELNNVKENCLKSLASPSVE